jgi:two-component system sensor histidine kinase DesK
MAWLTTIVRIAVAPVLTGALAVLAHSPREPGDVAAAVCLLALAAIHCVYWWEPWRRTETQTIVAAIGMALANFVLLTIPGFSEPLVWLYPALVAGAGLPTLAAILGITLMGLAAAAPLARQGGLIHPVDALRAAEALGPGHSVLLAIVLAGLGMHAVRQLIASNADLLATRAELADLAVAADRERLSRELHDLLARTLSLIAVKAELAARLSTRGDHAATAELADVQSLARQAVRDVRNVVTGSHSPSLEGELVAAESALRTAGMEVRIDKRSSQINPAHEDALAWALREAVTNVVKHSGARTCWIALSGSAGSASLQVEDDGRGPANDSIGAGLTGLADRVHAVGGELDVGPRAGRGFKVRVQLGPTSAPPADGAQAE